jgi:hypothetical protein
MTNPKQDHRIRWKILFDGEIRAVVDCYAETGALCQEDQECNAQDWIARNKVMECYRPTPGIPVKPLDSPIEVWWDPLEPGWRWKYPGNGHWWAEYEPRPRK